MRRKKSKKLQKKSIKTQHQNERKLKESTNTEKPISKPNKNNENQKQTIKSKKTTKSEKKSKKKQEKNIEKPN